LGGSGSDSGSDSVSGEGSPGEYFPEKVSQGGLQWEIPILRAYTPLQLRLRALQLSGSGALRVRISKMALPWRPVM